MSERHDNDGEAERTRPLQPTADATRGRDDATVLRPASSSAPEAESTVLRPGAPPPGASAPQPAAAAPPEATVLRPAAALPPAEATVLRPSAAVPPEATLLQPKDARPVAPATAGTHGSDWSHPEQWEAHGGMPGPGSVIKQRFLLESVLGHGGMGIVYRALDRRKEEARDRDPYVAIKILNDDFRRHPDALVALQREARKAQTLAHPNVITVHDFDRDGTTVYMTMELLDGEPLNRTIAAHTLRGLPWKEAQPIIRGMAAALAYAHQKGIVHADFKPGNVFTTRAGDVKVLDFGIARAVPTALAPDADNTVFDAATLGALTPGYASPEMLRGEAPTAADDVFALAIVAFELLTGRHPFDKMPAEEARRRGVRAPALPGVPRRARQVLTRALSFERDQRQADAGAFLKALDGPSPLLRAAYAATVVVLAGVAAYAFYSGSQLRPDQPFESLPAEEQAAFTAAVEEGNTALRFVAQAPSDALNSAFEYFAEAYVIHRNNPAAIAGLESVADGFLSRLLPIADPGAQRNIMRKLYCHEHLRAYRPVLRACTETLGDAQCSVAALGCPTMEQTQ